MNILKPQKKSSEKLIKIKDLLKEIETNEVVKNVNIENYKKENIIINDITIEHSIIVNTEITNSNLPSIRYLFLARYPR